MTLCGVKDPAAETAGHPSFECLLFLGVIPASEARLPAGRQVGNLSGKITDKPE
jgi:hypothetical protein